MRPVQKFDSFVALQISHLPQSARRPFELIGLCASPLAWIIILSLFTALQLPDNYLRAIVVIAVVPLATIVKLLFRRKRPATIYAGEMRIKSYSFPSSHSYASALGSSYLAIQATNAHLLWLAILLICIGPIVAVSRVFLGAHYPSDVMAGLVFGWLVITGVSLWM